MTTDFSKTKSQFYLPENLVYLDGNSLGPLAKSVSRRVSHNIDAEWGKLLIDGWNKAGWIEQPSKIGDRIGGLIGAPTGTIATGDTLSIKVYQALSAALSLNHEKKNILSDTGNFPTDLYMAQGLIKTIGQNHQLICVEPEKVIDALDDTIGTLLLTHVDYRTGRMHDMKLLTELAHKKGIITIWDLAHSAGAVPVDLIACDVDFAVGCTYKYLNSGPGGPAFIYVKAELQNLIDPALSGWLGHDAPFAFEEQYRAGRGIERMRVGTPSVIQFAALEAALDIWEEVDMDDLRKKSVELSEFFIKQIEDTCPMLALVSPREANFRGSQVSFQFENGFAAIQALKAHGVIGDFRAPNIMRFGFTPLYIDRSDVEKACKTIAHVMNEEVWDKPEYKVKSKVT